MSRNADAGDIRDTSRDRFLIFFVPPMTSSCQLQKAETSVRRRFWATLWTSQSLPLHG
jgi:hypothetical protein